MKPGDKVSVHLLQPFEGVITSLVWESPAGESDSVFAVVEIGTTTIHNVKGQNLEVQYD